MTLSTAFSSKEVSEENEQPESKRLNKSLNSINPDFHNTHFDELVDVEAKKIFNWMHCSQLEPEKLAFPSSEENKKKYKFDLILTCCSNDLRVPEYVVRDLFLKWRLAPRLLFSGGNGNFTENWQEAEADVFSRIAQQQYGVSESSIIVENKSTNSGENVRFSYELLKEMGLLSEIKKILLVTKTFVERRIYATFMAQWPPFVEGKNNVNI